MQNKEPGFGTAEVRFVGQKLRVEGAGYIYSLRDPLDYLAEYSIV